MDILNLELTSDIWARVRYRDKNLQWSSWSPELDLVLTDPTDVENDESIVVKEYKLHNNYPNPFNPSTIIKYDIANAGKVSLKIYSVTGALVSELVNRHQSSGRYSVVWDGTNLSGDKLSSGIYLYKLQTTDYQKIGKAILIK